MFLQHKSRPTLTSQETKYWKNTLKKILKVGKEFEFNLPESSNGCRGNDPTCPCNKIVKGENCWEDCSKYNNCKIPNIDKCMHRTDICKAHDCAKCKNYTMVCNGIFCPDFESICYGCKAYEPYCNECKNYYDPKNDPCNIRKAMKKILMPSNSYGIVSGYGVHSIVRDGSLLGDKGAEVITVGRRIDYWEFYNMSKKIIDLALSRNAYVNERCSTHMHLLASYYGKIVDIENNKNNGDLVIPGVPTNISELEKEMPEIILANFHQLCRRYQNAITWMTMALDDPNHMTRWEKFRVSILDISAITNTMRTVRQKIMDSGPKSKYGWVNYVRCAFNKNGSVNRFHVEMRAADGILSPSALAAIGCMYYALAIKAVEISRIGVLEVGDKEWRDQAVKIKNTILNNMKDYGDDDRFGNTSNLSKYFNILKSESHDLIQQIKHILIKIGPAYDVLEKLAEKPISFRRCDGETWEEIEKDLEISIPEETHFEAKMCEYIDLRFVDECKTIEEWCKAVSDVLSSDPDFKNNGNIKERVISYVRSKKDEGELMWSESIGSVVLI